MKDFLIRALRIMITPYTIYGLLKTASESADGYRERYELSTRRIDDIRLAINYLLALRRINMLLNEKDEAEDIKKKALVWKDKMDSDQKKGASK